LVERPGVDDAESDRSYEDGKPGHDWYGRSSGEFAGVPG